MKCFLLIFACAAALQVSLAEEHNVQQTVEQLQHVFDEMRKSAESVDMDKVKDEVTKKYQELETQMTSMAEQLKETLTKDPDSPAAKAYDHIHQAIEDFKGKHPEFENNVKAWQKNAAETGEKIASEFKNMLDKVHESGIKEKLDSLMNDWGQKMKETAVEIEAKVKEAMKH